MTETLSKVFTVDKVHLQNQQIQLRSTQRWSSSTKNKCQKLEFLYVILFRDRQCAFFYEFHIMFSCLIMHMCHL